MRYLQVVLAFIHVLAAFTGLNAASPSVQNLSVPTSAKIMDRPRMFVEAYGAGDPRPLVYQWRIIKHATQREVITGANSPNATLDIWWASPNSEVGVGDSVIVEVEVSFGGDPMPDDEPAVLQRTIQVTGLNRPPVPAINGNLGTPTNRRKSGESVNMVDATVDPDGDPYTPTWSFGKRAGGSYQSQLVMIGSHGYIASFTVPAITGLVDQAVILTVVQGLHTVTTEAVAHLEGAPQPPPSSPVTIVLNPPYQSVQRGATAGFTAVATSTDGQDVSFVWTFEGNTVQGGAPTRRSSTELESSFLVQTDGRQAREYLVGVRAFKYVSGTAVSSSTTTARLNVTQANQPPTARIKHDHDGNQVFDLAGSIYNKTSLRSVNLHGRDSTDDAGVANLSFQWRVISGAGAQVNPVTAADTRLSVPEDFEGNVEVELTVTDSGGLTSSARAKFTFEIPNEPPVAVMRYAETAGAWLGPVVADSTIDVSTRTVLLDATASTDDKGVEALTFAWSVAVSSYLSSRSGPEVTLTLPANGTGIKVTLRATDAKGESKTVAATFKFVDPNQPPVAALRYKSDEGSQWSQAADGATVELEAGLVYLDAEGSTDDGGLAALTFTWSAGTYGAYLSQTSGSKVNLNVPLTFVSTVTVTLTAKDASNASSQVRVSFKFSKGNAAPVAMIKYDEDGDGFYAGPFDSGHVVEIPGRQVALSGEPSTDDGPQDALQFQWTAVSSSSVTLSDPNARDTVLTVPSEDGSVEVTLTVSDAEGKSATAVLNVVFAEEEVVLSAQIVSAPEAAEPGSEVFVEGSGDGNYDPAVLVYEWRAFDGEGRSVEVFSNGTRARLVAPEMDGDSPMVRVEFRLRQGQAVSEWATAEVPLEGPKLYFSQLGVGRIPGTNLQFETAVVLINNSSRSAHVRAMLANNQAGPNWRIKIDGESRSDWSFEIPAGGARKFVVSDTEVGFGWMTVSSNVKLAGYLFYRVMDVQTGKTLREVPILPVQGRSFRTALDPGVNHDLALALVNTSGQAVRFRLVVTCHEGNLLESPEFELGPGEHLARFLEEILSADGGQGIAPEFVGGTLQIVAEGDAAQLVATILKTSEGLPLSILPVVAEE